MENNVVEPRDVAIVDEDVMREEDKVFIASQWQLMWWRFRKHKMAIFGGIVTLMFYTIALFWEFLAPYDPLRYDVKYTFVPPQLPVFYDDTGFHFPPVVYALKPSRDPETLAMVFTLDKTQKLPLRFFVHGDPVQAMGGVSGQSALVWLGDQ